MIALLTITCVGSGVPQDAFNLNDTIVAVATPPGPGIRTVVRIAGAGTRAALLSLSCSPVPTHRGCSHVTLQLSNVEVPALLTWLSRPASYTGDDTAELSVTSNPWLVDRLLHFLLESPDTRPAQPGEFTARAFLRGKLTLAQAEGVAALVGAQTNEQLSAARDLLAGVTGAEYRHWADEVANLLALVEAGIDFTDQEDVVAIKPSDLCQRLAAITTSLDHHIGSNTGSEMGKSLPVVALAGAPNAGKSTLFNALLGRTRAIASPTAGTTRDVIEEELDLSHDVPGAERVTLVDLAGLSRTEDLCHTDAAAQELAIATLARADMILWCDPTGTFSEAELQSLRTNRPGSLAAHKSHPCTILRVRTFADVPTAHESSTPGDVIRVCALDGWNLAPLRRAIADHASAGHAGGITSLLPRHRRAVSAAAASLKRAETLAQQDITSTRSHSPELIAGALRDALDEIGQLVGAISPDDVIGRVFSVFCVGK